MIFSQQINVFIRTIFVVFSVLLVCPIEGRILKIQSSIEPQYENCKSKDIYKLNSEFKDTSETEAASICIDCFIGVASDTNSLEDIKQILQEAKNGEAGTSTKAKKTSYTAFKDQLRKRVLGQVKTKIAQTQILQKCMEEENTEKHRSWFAKRFPKVDWPLMKALCEKKKEDFHTSIEQRWLDMRVSLALTSANLDQVDTSRRPNLSFPLSHEVSDFGSMFKLTEEEQLKAKERWAEHLSKVPLDKLSPEQFKSQFLEGKPLRQASTKELQEMRRATWELNKQSRDRYRKHIEEMPLIGYMKTGDSENEQDMDQAFSKYTGHLNDLLEKVEDKNVDMALLLSFGPLVEGLLKDNEGYCLAAEGARLKAERNNSLKTWGLVAAGVVAAVPCFMTSGAVCLGLGALVGAIGYKEAKEVAKESLERFLTGREYETIASLSEKESEAFWELMLLPTAAWGTTAGTAQSVKGILKRANSGGFDKLRGRLYPSLSTSQVRTAPLRRLSGRSVDEAEKTLKLSKVVKTEPLPGLGVNNPLLVTLEDGTKAVWKPRQNKLYSNYRAEVLAYELDRKFGFNLVPPTVERTIQGKKGSLQLFREHRSVDAIKISRYGQEELSPEVATKAKQGLKKQAVFDVLIENTDRDLKDYVFTSKGTISVYKNFLISPEGNIISIDNGTSFTGKQRGYRQEVWWFREEISKFRELDESKTIIENMRDNLTVEFEEEIADYLGKEDAALLMLRMRGIIVRYDYWHKIGN